MGQSDRFPTPEQRRVIERTTGAHLVLAPAGSGKTAVMTARLRLAIERGIDPSRSLCVTFTNRAAEEMRSRVAADLGSQAPRVPIRTFHGLCAMVLRSVADRIGLPREFCVYDDQDCIELLEVILKRATGPVRSLTAREFFFELAARKSGALPPELSCDRIPPLFLGPAEQSKREVTALYHRILAERGALDFGDLVYRVRSMFETEPDLRTEFEQRYDWIQVDEVQDTHFSEYDVLRTLARRSRNVALFGDLDQTIYEWRGSDPESILGRFRREFHPVEEHRLERNFRATRALLDYAEGFAASFERRRTALVPDDSLPAGEKPTISIQRTAVEEATWIAQEVARLRTADPTTRVGVLARTHARLLEIGRALAASAIPHVTIEEFEFFRRQEIKDLMARLRLLLQPDDSGSLRRLLIRPPTGIGNETLRKLEASGPGCGLRLSDLGRTRTHDDGEPFERLLRNHDHGNLVFLDVETTGLDTGTDEVIEIAAVRYQNGEEVARLQRWLRPTRPLGASSAIHGYDDEELARIGTDPKSAFVELVGFLENAHVVGHNVRFDLSILRSHANRLGVAWPVLDFDDTLDLARRFVDAKRHDLASLADLLSLDSRPTHRAADDVATTAALLSALLPRVRERAAERRALVRGPGAAFSSLATMLARFRDASRQLRPAEVVELVIRESGLAEFYRSDKKRVANLAELITFCARFDAKDISPTASLAEVVRYASLAKNVDHLRTDDARIPVVTVHQAKGLEFDVVFVAGLSEGEFPSFQADRDGRLEEERRLFYVAITRARRALYLSGHELNSRGMLVGPSRFLKRPRKERGAR